jgi:general secretion pathway protein N
MRQGVVLALVGAAVFVVVGIVTLPASLVAPRLPPEVRLDGVRGSIWNGSAARFAYDGVPLGRLDWRARPLELFSGRLAYAIDLAHPEGFVRGRVSTALGGTLRADDVELELPLTTLSPETRDRAWRGRLAGVVPLARIEGGWPVAVQGAFTMSDLRPPGADFGVGTYALDFDPGASNADRLVGRVRDVDAPLDVRAQLVVNRDRSYLLEGEVTPKAGAPPAIANSVAFLGVPDALGRRTFTITGTF